MENNFNATIIKSRNIFYIILSLVLLISCVSIEYEYDVIFDKENSFKREIDPKTLNGKVFKVYNGKRYEIGLLEEGKKSGKWLLRYQNGNQREQINYYNGVKNGLSSITGVCKRRNNNKRHGGGANAFSNPTDEENPMSMFHDEIEDL